MTNQDLINAAQLYGWRMEKRGDKTWITSKVSTVILSPGTITPRGNERKLSPTEAMRLLYPDRPDSPDPDDIYHLRIRKGLTRRQCAAVIGVHEITYGKYEFGDHKMTPENWKIMTDTLRYSDTILPKRKKIKAPRSKKAKHLDGQDLRSVMRMAGHEKFISLDEEQ